MPDFPATHATSLRVAASHASLAGHFPGRPLVPGVVILDEVLNCAQRWLGARVIVRKLSQAKFTAPLLPEQTVELQLSLQAGTLRFTVSREGTAIAQGALEIEQEPLP